MGITTLVLASGGGQCLAVNGCHSYGGPIVGIVVGIVLVVTFSGLALMFLRSRRRQRDGRTAERDGGAGPATTQASEHRSETGGGLGG